MGAELRTNGSQGQMGADDRWEPSPGQMGAEDRCQGQMGSNAGTEEHRPGLRSRGMDSPKDWIQGISNNQQPTIRKRVKKERKNGLEAQTMMLTKQKKKQNKANKANKAQSGEQNNNQPDRNGGDLPCGGRQPMNAAADPPNPPSSIFGVPEVVENRKVSFGESVDARN